MSTQFMTKEFWDNYKDISELVVSNNKLLPYSGVGFIYGLPASRKTTIAIDTVKTMDKFIDYLYIDMDSKNIQQVKETFNGLNKLKWNYYNTMLQNGNAKNVIELIKTISNNSVVIIDTWHQLINGESENDNDYAKKVMKILRTIALKKNLLIVLIAHSGKTNNDIRGASSVSGDATFKVLVTKDETNYILEVTKDSTGKLESSTAIISKESSIINSMIKYSTEINKKETKMKPKETAVTTTMIKKVNEVLSEQDRYSIGEFRDWLYDNYNSVNGFKPDDSLFCSNRFLKDRFTDFTEALFVIEKDGRSKYIVDFLYPEHKTFDEKPSIAECNHFFKFNPETQDTQCIKCGMFETDYKKQKTK